MEKVLTIITTYNRRESLTKLVAALLKDTRTDILIIDDCSDWDVESLTNDRVTVLRNTDHRGKAGFWMTYQDIFRYVRVQEQYDYYVILPDDVEPCPDFFSKAIEAYNQASCICISPLLTNLSLFHNMSRWGNKPVMDYGTYYVSHFFDCCTICKRDFFEALEWKMEPIAPSSNPFRSSGVGRQITYRLQALGKKMCVVKRTLLALSESESQMNPEERQRHPMYADWRDNENCVDIHMASLWRGGHVLKTIKSLVKQPETAKVYVTLNSYTNEQYKTVMDGIKELRKQFGKDIITRRGKNAKGSNEKLSQLPKSKAPYIAFADDDIIYPNDHLLRLIQGCNVHGAAVSLHGSRLTAFPIEKYYGGDRKMFSWNSALDEDAQVDILGSGVSLFRREWFTDDELKALYDDAPEISMDDIVLSCAYAAKGIERWVINHRNSAVTLKAPEQDEVYVYDQYRDNDSVQVAYINENYRK